jgi:hypothetical protein
MLAIILGELQNVSNEEESTHRNRIYSSGQARRRRDVAFRMRRLALYVIPRALRNLVIAGQ